MSKVSSYWVVTGVMAAFMGLGALTDVAQTEMTEKLLSGLGYPLYLLPFLGIMKLLGVATVLVPRAPLRLKEWAYAGLTFDLLAALYSHLRSSSSPIDWLPALLGLVLVVGSYVLHLRRNADATRDAVDHRHPAAVR